MEASCRIVRNTVNAYKGNNISDHSKTEAVNDPSKPEAVQNFCKWILIWNLLCYMVS